MTTHTPTRARRAAGILLLVLVGIALAVIIYAVQSWLVALVGWWGILLVAGAIVALCLIWNSNDYPKGGPRE